MGIPEFLKNVLPAAGRPLDLREWSNGIALGQQQHSTSPKRRRRQRQHHGMVSPLPWGTDEQSQDTIASESMGHDDEYDDDDDDEEEQQRRRPLRLGIDLSSWIYKASHGFGDMLGDERHLSNYGRAALYRQQQEQQQPLAVAGSGTVGEEQIQTFCNACTDYVLRRLQTLQEKSQAEVLVVLDGETPPIKKQEVEKRKEARRQHVRQRDEPVDPTANPSEVNEQRTKANRRAGAGKLYSRLVAQLLQQLHQQQTIAFLIAPYEADSQLAYLSQKGYIDIVVTEDSDLIAHGAQAILYKSVTEIGNGHPRGILLQFEDIGSCSTQLDMMDFSPIMMTVLFVCVGCDYCDKLKGIGLKTASRIVRDAFMPKPSLLSTNTTTTGNSSGPRDDGCQTSALAIVLRRLYQDSYTSEFSDEFQQDYELSFLAAIIMYRHPVVFDPIQRKCILVGAVDDTLGDAVLRQYPPYAVMCDDFDVVQDIVGYVPPADDQENAASSSSGGPATGTFTSKVEGHGKFVPQVAEDEPDEDDDESAQTGTVSVEEEEDALETQPQQSSQKRKRRNDAGGESSQEDAHHEETQGLFQTQDVT